jgi:hypothetical protein
MLTSEGPKANHSPVSKTDDLIMEEPREIVRVVPYIETFNAVVTDDKLAKKHEQLLNCRRMDSAYFSLEMDECEIRRILEAGGNEIIQIQRTKKNIVASFFVIDTGCIFILVYVLVFLLYYKT